MVDELMEEDGAGVSGDLLAQMAERLRGAEAEEAVLQEQLEGAGDKSLDRNEMFFSALATALPVLLGAAVDGGDGALAGLATGGKAGSDFAFDVADEADEEKAQLLKQIAGSKKERLGIEKLLLGSEEKSKDRANRVTAAREGKSVINVGDQKLNAAEKEIMQSDIATTKTLQSIKGIVSTVNSKDSKGNAIFNKGENFGQAIARNIKAKIFQDTEGAELKRRIQEWAIQEGKKNFPGAISDQERQFMLDLKGGSFNVPVQVIERIARRSATDAVDTHNAMLSGLKERSGIDLRSQPMNHVVFDSDVDKSAQAERVRRRVAERMAKRG